MGEFYGMNIFLAETSATSGGLDSLLEPHGPIKKAQEKAARAFGAKQTFFSTNGTSTCNKIVVQAIVRPGDIVLVDRDCHKSHHYGMVLAGAQVVYLDSYPLNDYSMYGAVPLREIKHRLLELKAAGKLDRVRMLLLTNCTFDGIIQRRTRDGGMPCHQTGPGLSVGRSLVCLCPLRPGLPPPHRHALRERAEGALSLRGIPRRLRQVQRKNGRCGRRDAAQGAAHARSGQGTGACLRHPVHPQDAHRAAPGFDDPCNDQDFKDEVEQAFHEAYMTHTSTSPNYQIIASLDVGRRQVELEGFEFIQRQVEQAMSLRKAINHHPLISKYFHVLRVADMIPAEYRKSGIKSYWDPEHGWSDIMQAWTEDEFVLDATRVTLSVSASGWDGDTFKNQILMDRHGIQINKTSRNTVLFMTNIGTTRSSIAYLIEVPVKIAAELDDRLDDASNVEKDLRTQGQGAARGPPALAGLQLFPRRVPPQPRRGHAGRRHSLGLLPRL